MTIKSIVNHSENTIAYQELKSPVTVQSELTAKCPNRCVYCYNYWRDEKKPIRFENELNLDDWLKIGKKLVGAEIFRNVLTGGEPLTRKNIVYPLAEYFISKGIEVKLNTSMVPLLEDDCHKIKETGIGGIFAGFPSAIEESYNRITKSKNYKKAIQGLKYVLKYDIPIAINMVVTKLNKDEVYQTGEFFHSLGINSFAATPAIPCPVMNSDLELTNEDIINTLDNLLALEGDYNMNVDIVEAIPRCSITNPVRYEKFLRRDCGAGRTTIAVSSSGKVRPCTHSFLDYGNLLEEDIQLIWKRMIEWREGVFVPTSCANQCNEFTLCSLGCREAAKYKKGSYLEKDPRTSSTCITQPRVIIPRVKDIDPDAYFSLENDLRYRKEEKGYLVFSLKNSGAVYLSSELFNFIGILKRNGHFSVKSIQKEFDDSKVLSIMNYLNMKGVIKQW